MEDRFDISQVSVTFKKIGNNKYYGIGVGCPVLRIYEDEGVTGDYRNQYADNFYSCTGRVLNSGDMIIETSKSDTDKKTDPAIIDNTWNATSYYYCTML